MANTRGINKTAQKGMLSKTQGVCAIDDCHNDPAIRTAPNPAVIVTKSSSAGFHLVKRAEPSSAMKSAGTLSESRFRMLIPCNAIARWFENHTSPIAAAASTHKVP
jgi:hypothetical protein